MELLVLLESQIRKKRNSSHSSNPNMTADGSFIDQIKNKVNQEEAKEQQTFCCSKKSTALSSFDA
jgi:hypothetical protein